MLQFSKAQGWPYRFPSLPYIVTANFKKMGARWGLKVKKRKEKKKRKSKKVREIGKITKRTEIEKIEKIKKNVGKEI